MIPYDSFLIDPFLLFASAWACAWIAARLNAAARVRFVGFSGAAVLAVFWITSVSLYFNCEWTRWIWEMCRAENGRDWMINSGVFRFEFLNPPPLTHVLSAACFVTYPLWFWLGAKAAFRTHGIAVADPLARRFRGQKGRVETWYVTMTDPVTGEGYWLHGEIFSPSSDGHFMTRPRCVRMRQPCVMTRGWCVIFGKDKPPRMERYGPEPFDADSAIPLSSVSAVFGRGVLKGRAGSLSWDLTWQDGSSPLFTFPRWAWEAEILPGAQIVAAPSMTIDGAFRDGNRVMPVRGALGAFGRIFSKGHAERWVWLHADLGGGDVLEIVAAQSRHGLFRGLGLLGFVALCRNGSVWPRQNVSAALKGFRAEILPSGWALSGTHEGMRIEVDVTIPSQRSVTVEYDDPDGSKRRCTNSELASARIKLEKRISGGWAVDGAWEIAGTAHAEIGGMVR